MGGHAARAMMMAGHSAIHVMAANKNVTVDSLSKSGLRWRVGVGAARLACYRTTRKSVLACKGRSQPQSRRIHRRSAPAGRRVTVIRRLIEDKEAQLRETHTREGDEPSMQPPSQVAPNGPQGQTIGPNGSDCGCSDLDLDTPKQSGNGQGNRPFAPHLTHGMFPQTTPAPLATLGQALGTGWSNIRTASHTTQTMSTSTCTGK